MSVRGARAWRPAVIVTAVASVLALAGCGGIPRTGPVVPGRALDEAALVDRSVLAAGPEPGAPPQEIVRDFFAAQADFTESHAVARSYLVNGQVWRPDSPVTIYPSASPLTVAVLPSPSPAATASPAGGTVRVTVGAPVEATVDESGIYHAAQVGQRWALTLSLQQVGGEWRIKDPPAGMALSYSLFKYVFTGFPVYFPDRSGNYLVPDVRWFPHASGPTNRLVRALFDGPSPWLAGAVTTGAPPGTRATVPAVVTGQVATIDLTREALAATPLQREYLLAQLRATLAPRVTDLRLTVRQVEFSTGSKVRDVKAGESGPSLTLDPQVDPRPLVLDAEGHIARVDGALPAITAVKGLERLARPGAEAPGSDATGSSFTVLSARRTQVLHGVPGQVDPPEVLLTGTDLTPPSNDPTGWVWSAPAQAGGTVLAARPGGDRVQFKVPWLAGLRVVSLRVSRDGARVVVAATGKGVNGKARAWLYLASVERASGGSDAGRPIALGRPEELLPDLADVVDAAWVDEVHVAVLGTRTSAGPGQVRPWTVLVGGPVEALPVLAGARTIAARDLDSFWISTAAGQLYTLAPSGWQKAGHGAWVSMPG